MVQLNNDIVSVICKFADMMTLKNLRVTNRSTYKFIKNDRDCQCRLSYSKLYISCDRLLNVGNLNLVQKVCDITEDNIHLLSKLPNLRVVKFDDSFNSPIDGTLPDTIVKIEFGYSFNQYLNKSPVNLEVLIFGAGFWKPIDNIPDTVTYLSLDHNFGLRIDRLPSKLEYLRLGYCYSHKIRCRVPCTLEQVVLPSGYCKYYLGSFPRTTRITYEKW